MPIERSGRRIGGPRLTRLAHALLDASPLCAIATVGPRSRAHINTAYFAYTPALEIVWISEPGAAHSRNLEHNPAVAIAVFDSHQDWGGSDRGIQLFGAAGQPRGAKANGAIDAYRKRFAEYAPDELAAYHPYLFRPRRMKLFDEAALGSGVFVACTVDTRGHATWEATDVYKAS